ncbi:uncharacterized protein LOC110024368 [Phalaenopsis equestris]|uniref:uncharacterized protein LOC110024368 n=1 Tax=Phalaenopsis equestris TaxID=78828 RepID=UPI0009E2E24A|nr:uncharacterized protein LOC110024368 [Phalaenopsis equestris]XP_020579952.1 uncharacterized protein LOC110024368 [Phalaenopsis equestris]
MDLTTFKLDIDELVDDFTRENSTELTDFKRVWFAKKFSYIYEASPRTNSVFFMQSLFAHSIGHMSSSTSLFQRLGGLYCLYCLYETQPYKPRVKIYLCLGELKRLKLLVVDAKENGIRVVPALVKKMLTENMFLFGSSDSGSTTQGADAAKKLQEKNFQIAYEKLLSNTEIDDYVHMNLGVELGLESFKKMSTDYVKAKEEAIKEASKSISVEDIKHIAENASLASDAVDKLVKEWDSQKEIFYKQTGLGNCRAIVTVDDEGFAEVERLLDE